MHAVLSIEKQSFIVKILRICRLYPCDCMEIRYLAVLAWYACFAVATVIFTETLCQNSSTSESQEYWNVYTPPRTMASQKLKLSAKAHLPFKSKNKEKRQSLHINRKRATDSIKRDERFRRRREEDKNPTLREQRLKENVPLTLERKRVWDDVDSDVGDGLGVSVNIERLKRRKVEEEQAALEEGEEEEGEEMCEGEDEERDSMIESASEDEAIEIVKHAKAPKRRTPTERATSPVQSTRSTNLDFTPEALTAKFPTLFSTDAPPVPKVLITTSLNSTLHKEADHLTSLFPHSVYIPRSSHRYSHKFSVREICSFATKYVLHLVTFPSYLVPQSEF